MAIYIITADKRTEWDNAVRKVPGYDVFYLNDYLRAFQIQGSGEPLLAVYSNGNDYAVNAFFRRDVADDTHFTGKIKEDECFDLSSPYGYGGFIGEVTDWEQLEREWNEYCIKEGYVCEFVRFGLFGDYRKYFSGVVETHTHNVVRDLEMPIEKMWMDFKQKVRKNVRKAESFNLEIIFDSTGEKLDDFLRIYYGTMNRTEAKDEYYFPEQFFKTLNRMQNNVMYFHVAHEGKIISTELVIYGTENAYSYLGGTDKNYFKMRPNDFLKYEIIKWAKKKGLKRFVLGGGYGSDDGIFEYKKCIAPHGIMDFWIGKKIFDREKYNELCRMKEGNYSEEGFFPAYRV